MQCLDDVTFASEVMRTTGRLSPRHLSLDALEAVQHLCLELLESIVQDLTADAVEFPADLK